jgi:hypothetical protein
VPFLPLDPGLVKKIRIRIRDKKNPDHISESLETIFWVNKLKFSDAAQGWKKLGSQIRDKTSRIRNTGPDPSDEEKRA